MSADTLDLTALHAALAAEGITVTDDIGVEYLGLGIGIRLIIDHDNLAGIIQLPPTVRHHTDAKTQQEIAAETAMHLATALRELHPQVVSRATWDRDAVIITLA